MSSSPFLDLALTEDEPPPRRPQRQGGAGGALRRLAIRGFAAQGAAQRVGLVGEIDAPGRALSAGLIQWVFLYIGRL